jgi:hypothetical protein
MPTLLPLINAGHYFCKQCICPISHTLLWIHGWQL